MRNILKELTTLFMLFIVGTVVLLSYVYILYAITTTADSVFMVTPTVTYEKDDEGNIISAASSVPFSETGDIEQKPVDQAILYRKEKDEP